MSIQNFFDKWNGKPCDYDFAYGNQCVDLYDQYCQEVVSSPINLVNGAVDIWNNYPTSHFDRVLNTPEAVPVKGDVIIWSRTTSLPWGHVGIFNEGDVNRFTSFDQNWPTDSLCHFQEHKYTGVIGWLHPKVQSTNELTECLKQHTELVTKCGNLENEIKTLKQTITDKELTVTNLNKAISDLESGKNVLAEDLKICQLSVQEHAGCQSKILEATSLKNQAEQDLATSKGAWTLKEVAYQKQVALLTTKYTATKSSIKKLLVDYIFGKNNG